MIEVSCPRDVVCPVGALLTRLAAACSRLVVQHGKKQWGVALPLDREERMQDYKLKKNEKER